MGFRLTKKNKYHAVKETVDGIRFDSRAEAQRYRQLKMLQQAGVSIGLACHPRFELIPGAVLDGIKEQGIYYTADFSYVEPGGGIVVEDVKGVTTRDYLLRRKMMLLIRGIEVREIDANTLKERVWRKKKKHTRSGYSII